MRFRLIPHRQFLSLFINNKLGIFAVFLVGADQEEVHIGGDTEATVTAEFTFKLAAEVGRVIVKEFYLCPFGRVYSRLIKLPDSTLRLSTFGSPSM